VKTNPETCKNKEKPSISSSKNQTLKKNKLKTIKSQEKIKTKTQFFDKNLNFSELTPLKLREFLKEFKRFPDKNRAFIWEILLSIPNNEKSFKEYEKKGIHPSFLQLENNFPIESQFLYEKLQKMLSYLSYYCSIFTKIDYLPALIFPFVKILKENEIICFEIIITFLRNFAKDFFVNFPNSPINFLENCEDLLKYHDFELFQHFNDKNIDFLNVSWPVFQANFSGILAKDDWLVFIDNLFAFSDKKGIYSMFFIAYLIYFRNSLLNLRKTSDFSLFFTQQNAINIEKIIENTHKLLNNTPKDLISLENEPFSPLNSKEYQNFTSFPQLSLDFHEKIREKIALEEKELLQRKKSVLQLNFLSEELIEKEKKYRKRQENLLKVENERRQKLLQEENARFQQKIEEDRLFRNKRIEQLKLLENTITNSLKNQEKLREEELSFLQKELDSRKEVEDYLLESKLEEEALLGLEFTMSQKINDIVNMRNREERQRKLRQELDYKNKQENFSLKLMEERWKNEDLEANLRRELQKQQKLSHLNEMEERNDDENIRYNLLLEGFEKDLKLMELDKERKLRQLAEEETIKNEKLIETFTKQEELAQKEDEKHIKTILNNEKQALIEKSREIIKKIKEGNKRHEEEIELHREKLRNIASVQKRADFEEKIFEIKKNNDLRLLEEERKLQKMVIDLEEDEKIRAELKEAIVFKEEECRERDRFYQSLKENQEQLINEEKARFKEYQDNYKMEREKMRKINEETSHEKLQQYHEKNIGSFSQNHYKNNFEGNSINPHQSHQSPSIPINPYQSPSIPINSYQSPYAQNKYEGNNSESNSQKNNVEGSYTQDSYKNNVEGSYKQEKYEGNYRNSSKNDVEGNSHKNHIEGSYSQKKYDGDPSYSYSYSNTSNGFSEEKGKRNLGKKEKREEILIQEDEGENENNQLNSSENNDNFDYDSKYKSSGSDSKYKISNYENKFNKEEIKPQRSNSLKNNTGNYYENKASDSSKENQGKSKENEFDYQYYENKYKGDNYEKKHKEFEEKYKENYQNYHENEEKISKEKTDEELSYSPDFEEKKKEVFDENRYEMEDLNEESEEDSQEEKQRRIANLDINEPKYREHSNTPDRFEVLDEEENLFQ